MSHIGSLFLSIHSDSERKKDGADAAAQVIAIYFQLAAGHCEPWRDKKTREDIALHVRRQRPLGTDADALLYMRDAKIGSACKAHDQVKRQREREPGKEKEIQM